MQKRVSDDYVVAKDLRESTSPGLGGTVELVSNNLASRQALTLSDDTSKSNAILGGKAHQIDGALYQYWLTVTPRSESDGVSALSASAYIVLPDAALAQTRPVRELELDDSQNRSQPARAPALVSIPNAGRSPLISPLQLAAPDSFSDCKDSSVITREAGYMSGVRPCSLLLAKAQADSIVFFLQHQANHGLVRLSGAECRTRTTARIVRKGEAVRFPIAKTNTGRQNWSETYDWMLEPDLDTYYAVVISDARTARRIANHMDELPLRCSASIRPGFEGDELQGWLADFAMITARSANNVDWRGLRVKDIL